MHIEIVRRPLGEAPEWVRDAWIGVSLPLAVSGKKSWQTFGVLEAPKGFFASLWMIVSGQTEQVDGYMVVAKEAVDILGIHNPDAADWWRENTPALLDGKQMFIFDAPCCEEPRT